MGGINVGLLGVKGEFVKNTGSGVKRYMYELYTNTKHANQINVQKIELSQLNMAGKAISLSLGTMFLDFSNFDIIHSVEPVNFLKPKVLLGKTKILTTIHDFQPIIYPEIVSNNLKNLIWSRVIMQMALTGSLNSDHILVDSTQTKEEAIKLDYPKSQISVANLGIDNRFRSNIIKNNKKGIVVGYVGGLGVKKNPAFAIDAFRNLETENDHSKTTRLEIWGNTNIPEYKDLLAKTSGGKNIIFKGFAPEKKLIHIYDTFDIFVFPSLHEGFGLPILEAQARGLPVIIYKHGKIPKEVRKYCLEAEGPEHMAQIIRRLKEDGYNEKQRKKAIKYSRSFTWEKTIKKTLETYTTLTDNS